MDTGTRRRVVSRATLSRPGLEVAPDLLGCVLSHETPDGRVAVRLTEVEAYMGADDPGSHAYRGRTPRNEVMFGEAGHLYVYFTYGMHFCANVVCGPEGTATAVLLRAGEVIEGRDLAYARRTANGSVRRDTDLGSGPARLAVALGLDRSHDGADIVGNGPVSLLPPPSGVRRPEKSAGPRVGVSGAGGDGDLHPWRFWITGDATVSRYRRA